MLTIVHFVYIYSIYIYIHTGETLTMAKKTGSFYGNFKKEVIVEYTKIVGKGNVGPSIERYMESVIANKAKDIHKINRMILLEEIQTIEERIGKDKGELDAKRAILDQINKEIKQKKLQALKEEKEQLMREVTCLQCGQDLSAVQFKKFKKGNVCVTCYQSADRRMVEAWM